MHKYNSDNYDEHNDIIMRYQEEHKLLCSSIVIQCSICHLSLNTLVYLLAYLRRPCCP